MRARITKLSDNPNAVRSNVIEGFIPNSNFSVGSDILLYSPPLKEGSARIFQSSPITTITCVDSDVWILDTENSQYQVEKTKSKVIETLDWWDRKTVEKDNRVFIFGDNTLGRGNAGQACIRGLSNAYGVPTKWSPTMVPEAFFHDADLVRIKGLILMSLAQIPFDKDVVYNSQIGCGLARMNETCPQGYGFLLSMLRSL